MTTFDQLLTLLEDADDDLDLVATESVVIDLKDKVDKVKYVLDKLQNYSDFLDAQLEPLAKAKRSANANIAHLKRTLALSMENHNVEQLPGVTWRLNLQDNPPSVSFSQPTPGPLDYQMYPEMVELVRSYKWKTDVVRDKLQDGEELSFASLKQGKHVRFYLNKPLQKAKSTQLQLEGTLQESADDPAPRPERTANKPAF